MSEEKNNLRGILNTTSSLRGRLNVLTLEFGDGRDIELSVIENYLVWRRVGDAEWKQLFSLDTITPQRGTDYWTEEDKANILESIKDAIEDDVADEVDALEALAECGLLTPAYQDGTFYTDADGAIYVI